VAIAAHDDHVRIQIRRGRQDRVSNVLIVGHELICVLIGNTLACFIARKV
jgi:hypothetical protein